MLSAIGKEKINIINELEENLIIETVKKRMKEKRLSFEIKNKGIATRKIIELEIKGKSRNNN